MDRNKTKTKENTNTSIACMGLDGSFGHIVARRLHPTGTIVSHTSIDNVGRAVANGESAVGVLPIENSTAGTIQETFDTLLRNNLSIVGERFLPVVHHLLVRKTQFGAAAVQRNAIKTILSHPKAFEQCRLFLETLPNAKLIMVHDTADAARRVAMDPDSGLAAIASQEAARAHGLRVLVGNIHSNPDNCTRFVIVQKRRNGVLGTKATISAVLPHIPGSLHRLLGSFAAHHLNLTHIESRPIGSKPWEYRFLIDLDIGKDTRLFQRSLLQARSIATTITILGIYDKGVRL
ncbi:MAG: prephenate dehydratase domain-containing protein [Patescibacteria group bacterium]